MRKKSIEMRIMIVEGYINVWEEVENRRDVILCIIFLCKWGEFNSRITRKREKMETTED